MFLQQRSVSLAVIKNNLSRRGGREVGMKGRSIARIRIDSESTTKSVSSV